VNIVLGSTPQSPQGPGQLPRTGSADTPAETAMRYGVMLLIPAALALAGFVLAHWKAQRRRD